jgi:hypothetical protein
MITSFQISSTSSILQFNSIQVTDRWPNNNTAPNDNIGAEYWGGGSGDGLDDVPAPGIETRYFHYPAENAVAILTGHTRAISTAAHH